MYQPRESLPAIASQYWGYGRFKALAFVTAPYAIRPRHLAPLGLVAVALTALTPSRLARPARVAVALYGALLTAVTARSNGGWRTFPVLATIHATWGSGLLLGLAQIGARKRRRARRR